MGKAIIFSTLLFLSSSSRIFTAAALLLALFFYSRPMLHWDRFIASFIALILSFFLFTGSPGALMGGILLFLLLGAKEMSFVRYDAAYYAAHGILLFSFAFFLLSHQPFSLPVTNFIFTGGIFFFLVKELLGRIDFDRGDFHVPHSQNLAALVFTLLFLEIIWTLFFLPFPPFMAALLGLCAFLIIEDFFFRSLRGLLSRKAVLSGVTVLAVLILVFAGITDWRP